MSADSPKTFWYGVIVLLVGYWIMGLSLGPLEVVADGREYLVMAENLRHFGTFTYDAVHPVVGKPPGFPAFVAMYLSLIGSLDGFQWLQLALMFSAFLAVTLAVRRLWSPRAALLVLGLLVAAWPLHYCTRNLYSEALFMALTGWGLYATFRCWRTPSWWLAVVAGALFGLSTYVRPINLAWPVVLLLAALLFRRSRWRATVIMLVAHLVVVAPWIARNWVTFDRFVPMVANWGPLYYMTDEALWQQYYFGGSGPIRASEGYREITQGEFPFNWTPSERFKTLALDRIRAHPGDYLARCVRQMAFAWTYIPGSKELYLTDRGWFYLGRAAMILFYVAVFLGVLALVRRGRHDLAILGVAYAVSTSLVVFPVCTESRYLLPAYIWLLPLALVGCASILQRWKRRTLLPHA